VLVKTVLPGRTELRYIAFLPASSFSFSLSSRLERRVYSRVSARVIPQLRNLAVIGFSRRRILIFATDTGRQAEC